jgi:hypothetical protein
MARLYRYNLDRHILPGIGALHLGEAPVSRLDEFIAAVRDRSGTGAAARTIPAIVLAPVK